MQARCLLSMAILLVTEQVGKGDESAILVLASNVYQKLVSGGLMIEHHASVVQVQQDGHTLQ